MPYLNASAVVIHYEEALYQVYAPLPLLYCMKTCDETANCFYSSLSGLIDYYLPLLTVKRHTADKPWSPRPVPEAHPLAAKCMEE